MGFYELFNSKEEADYLRDMDYEFTMPEAAYVIYHSQYATLTKKLLEWRDLADTMPDIEAEETDETVPPGMSFHRFLRAYCCQQEELIEKFFEPGDAVYQYAIYQNVYEPGDGREGIWKFVEDPQCFSDFRACYDAWYSEFKEHGLACPGARPPRIRFLRRGLLTAEKQTGPCLWIEMELMDKVITIQERHILTGEKKRLNEAFRDMHFTFPTPFCAGDILVNNWAGHGGCKKGPFVLDRTEGDRYRAVYLDEYETGPHLFKESDGPVLNLERYKEPLKGPQKVLKGVSSAMAEETKNNRQVNPVSRCRAYSLILEEELCKADKQAVSREEKRDEY